MDQNSVAAGQTTLAPGQRMFPPDGCRGALSAWPQLRRAAVVLGTPSAAQVGGPAQLAAAIAIAPALLQGARAPADLFGHYAWLIMRILGAARTMAGMLDQLPPLLAQAQLMRGHEPAAVVRDALTGPTGLQAVAKRIEQQAAQFTDRLAEFGQQAARHQALSDVRAGGAQLERLAASAAGTAGDQLDTLHAATVQMAQAGSDCLDQIQARAAATSANAILDNVMLAMRGMGGEWRKVSANLAAIAATRPDQLGDPRWLRETLGMDGAAAQWRSFADEVQAYAGQLLGCRC